MQETEDIRISTITSPLKALDLNENKRGTVPHEHRFSIQKTKEGLQAIDPLEWHQQIQLPQNDYFSYPSSMLQAELHRQCHYICPDKQFVSEIQICPCCNKKLSDKSLNYFTYDPYKQFTKDYGIALPLYFTFLKMHLLIMLFQFLSYGLFYIVHSKMICHEDPHLQCNDSNYEFCNACEFVGLYGFIDPQNFRDKIRMDWTNSVIFQTLAFAVFAINVLMPILHDVVMMYHRIRYWDMEKSNHIKEHKCSVYVKHLPHKMTTEEVQLAIQKALLNDVASKKSVHLFQDQNAIDELIYIYDIHELVDIHQQRVSLFQSILLIGQQLTEIKETGSVQTLTIVQKKNKKLNLTYDLLEKEFRAKVQELVVITARIKQYLKEGLPFTNKVIIKFHTREQRDAVYLHYKKSMWENMRIRFNVLRRVAGEMKSRKAVRDFDVESDDMSSRAGSFLIDSQIDTRSHDNSLAPIEQKQDELTQTMLLKLQNDYENDRHDHKELRIYRGFREQEIFWINIGMNTLTRFLLRVRSLGVTLVACSIMMILFELMYLYQNNPQFKKQKNEGSLTFAQKVLADIFTIMVTVVSSISTLVLLAQTRKSKRSTYTQQEKNIANFMLFIQLILITAFPFVISLEFWGGMTTIITLYDLITLGRNRILFKLAFHTFHIRHTTFWCRKRKIIKNFSPHIYVQGQLNELMTPPQFPHRGRLIAMFFIYTTGVAMLYVCPMMMVLCIICDIYLYFFDKRAVVRNYQVDPTFSIKHMQYLTRTYQLIVTPLTMYLYVRIFYWSRICIYVGSIVCVVVVPFYLFFGNRITKFIVLRVIRPKRIKSNKIHHSRSYLQSYNEFYQNLKVEHLTSLLASLFKQVQSFRESKI